MNKNNTDDKTSISLEQILGAFVIEINNTVGKMSDEDENSACSIFLYDHRRDAYVLRASTLGTPFLGKDCLDYNEKKLKVYKDGKRKACEGWESRVGLTVTAIFSGETVISKGNEIIKDERASSYGMTNEEIKKSMIDKFCEFYAYEICSLIAAPIFFNPSKKPDDKPDGVVRVVRKTGDNVPSFSEDDKIDLGTLIENKKTTIQSSAFLANLIELGSHIDIHSLCKQSAEVLRDILHGKGCSVFLIDEDAQGHEEKTYRCFGTTGLCIEDCNIHEEHGRIKDPFHDSRTFYKYCPNKSDPASSITVRVIRSRICEFIDDVYKFDDNKIIPGGYRIKRKPGHGQCSEYFEAKGAYQKSHSILYAPMFYRDPDNTDIDVLGVVRVTRPDNVPPFSTIERHLFVSMVESLSKAINFTRLVEFIDKVAQKKAAAEFYKYVVENIPKFVGAKDCALLLKDGDQLKYEAVWKEGKAEFRPKDYKSYDLKNEKERGYTGSVAVMRESLLFNGEEEREKVKASHRRESGGEPYRFLGVPIGVNPEGDVGAVLRICKDEKSSRLTEEDEQVLTLIGRRIWPHIKEIVRLEEEEEKCRKIKDHYFSSELQDRIEALDCERFCAADLLKQFLSGITSDTRMEKALSDFIPELWEFYSYHDGISDHILEDFEFFNDKILSDIPQYRDHFIHQFVVYLIGAVIIGSISEDFTEYFERSYPEAVKRYSDLDTSTKRKLIERAWLITALFHDVAYPLETANLWLQRIIGKFLRGPALEGNSLIRLEGVLFAPDYINRFDQLAAFHAKYFEKKNACELRAIMMESLVGNKFDAGLDHGLMGALLLLGDDSINIDELLPCASAIALHNRMVLSPCMNKIRLEEHPLAFLLLYCDILHEWGRGEPKADTKDLSARLNDFCLLVSCEDLERMGVDISHVKKDKSDKKWIFANIKMEEGKNHKRKEIRDRFFCLKSKEYHFGIQVNRDFYSSHVC